MDIADMVSHGLLMFGSVGLIRRGLVRFGNARLGLAAVTSRVEFGWVKV